MVDKDTKDGTLVLYVTERDESVILLYLGDGSSNSTFGGKVVYTQSAVGIHVLGNEAENWIRDIFKPICDFQVGQQYEALLDVFGQKKGDVFDCVQIVPTYIDPLRFTGEHKVIHLGINGKTFDFNFSILSVYAFEFKSLASVVDTSYPHKCPKCSGPAYIGFNSYDCKRKCK